MSNTFDIFKYGLLNFNERAKDSLFGEKQSVQPGQDTMRRSDEGLVGQSMNFAGGVYDSGIAGAKDYAFGKEKLVSSPSIGQTERPGFKGSEMDQDINKGLDKGIELFDKGVNYSVKKGNEFFSSLVMQKIWSSTLYFFFSLLHLLSLYQSDSGPKPQRNCL